MNGRLAFPDGHYGWPAFLVATCLGFFGCATRPATGPLPREFESLTIYCYQPSDPLQLPTVPHVQVGAKCTRRLLANCEYHRRWVLGKGAYPARARTADGRTVRLSISMYGAFFAIEDQEGFWDLAESQQKEWERIRAFADLRVFQEALFKPLEAQQRPALRLVKIGEKYGYLDEAGRVAVHPRFDDALPFSGGLAAVRVGNPDEGKWGYIDPSGRFVIEPRFAGASFFSEGMAAVTVDDFFFGKQGYINRRGQMVIEPQFDGAWPFVNGTAQVWFGDGEGPFDSRLVDKKGTFITARYRGPP